MTKRDRRILKLIKRLLKSNVSVIYPAEIAHQLHYPIEVVEDVLIILEEKERLEHSYELHCCQCGDVMSVFESPKLLTSAPFPCDSCYSQADSLNMNDTVSAYYPVKITNARSVNYY